MKKNKKKVYWLIINKYKRIVSRLAIEATYNASPMIYDAEISAERAIEWRNKQVDKRSLPLKIIKVHITPIPNKK